MAQRKCKFHEEHNLCSRHCWRIMDITPIAIKSSRAGVVNTLRVANHKAKGDLYFYSECRGNYADCKDYEPEIALYPNESTEGGHDA